MYIDWKNTLTVLLSICAIVVVFKAFRAVVRIILLIAVLLIAAVIIFGIPA